MAELIPIRPCRLFDTRYGGGAPLAGGSITYHTVRDFCRIPVNATGITYNLTAVAPTASGYVTLFPRDALQPTVSSLNFSAGEVRGNAGLVQLSQTAGTQDLAISVATNPSGQTTHLVLDVTGYTAGSLANVAARAVGHTFTPDRFLDQGDGTVVGRLTSLQWELKTDDGSIHDKDNVYSWSATPPFEIPNGSVFTTFLAGLTNFPCFAGYCDWRLPTIDELQTLIEPGFPDCTLPPCTGIHGHTYSSWYFSSATDSQDAGLVWAGHFGDGQVLPQAKSGFAFGRAVRGGIVPRQ